MGWVRTSICLLAKRRTTSTSPSPQSTSIHASIGSMSLGGKSAWKVEVGARGGVPGMLIFQPKGAALALSPLFHRISPSANQCSAALSTRRASRRPQHERLPQVVLPLCGAQQAQDNQQWSAIVCGVAAFSELLPSAAMEWPDALVCM